MELNGKNFEIDLFDVEILENYQKAADYLVKVKKPASDNMVAFIKDYCNIVYRFFDIFLGEGTASNLFENKRNLKVCDECIQKCIKSCNDYLQNHFEKDMADTLRGWNDLLKNGLSKNSLPKNDLSK